jgi:hypothetical protein
VYGFVDFLSASTRPQNSPARYNSCINLSIITDAVRTPRLYTVSVKRYKRRIECQSEKLSTLISLHISDICHPELQHDGIMGLWLTGI